MPVKAPSDRPVVLVVDDEPLNRDLLRRVLYRDYRILEAGDAEAALALVDRLELDEYHYLHATRAELLRRLDRPEDARAAYVRALELVHSDAERRFLEQRLDELAASR